MASNAIDSYAAVGDGRGRRGPERLEQLLRDERGSVVRRHLCMMYLDPFTGSPDWIPVHGEDGSIVGVASRIVQASKSGARLPWGADGFIGKRHRLASPPEQDRIHPHSILNHSRRLPFATVA